MGSFGTGAVHRASLTDGLARELVAPFGLGGALAGLKVADGALWACVNPADVSIEASRLVKVDPDTGEELASYTLALYTFCNDLVRAPSGDVYVTDSYQSLIFRLSAGGSALELWFSDAAYAPASGSFGFNGIEMAPDASAVLVGRMDTGEIVRVPVEPDSAAGAATTDTMPGPVSYGGVDGMVWSGDELLAVRDYQVVSMTASGTTWSSSLVDANLDAPTTVAVDPDGGVWVVESQFSKLFDGDDSTNGVAPYRVVRVRR